jgi:molybdopterin converting factor small subunit
MTMNNDFKSYKKVIVPANHRFFGEDSERGVEAFLTEFEPNSIISKGLTGCGATTILLENNQPMILSCPTNELCHDKSTAQRHVGKVLWYEAGTKDDVIKDYLQRVIVPKFISVYDQTSNLYKALCRIEKQNVGSKYVLAVDEVHMLMTALSYREKAITQLTNLFSEFDNAQFITATPLPAEFTPEALLQFKYVEYEWSSGVGAQILTSMQTSPLGAASKLINGFKLEGGIDVTTENRETIEANELIFFINSVTDIATLISTCKLSQEECKIIVADNYSNRNVLAKAFGIESSDVEIVHASSPNKLFTFVTSKAFEGVDFYSESALSVVVSRVSSKNTLLDMNVSLPQIAGRIRTPENKLKNTILFIYNTSAYGKSDEELENELQNDIKEVNALISGYGRCKVEEKKAMLKRFTIDFEHGLLQLDDSEEEPIIKVDFDAIKLKRYQNYITTTFNDKMKVINTIEQHASVTEIESGNVENSALTYLRKQPLSEVAERYAQLNEKVNDDESESEGEKRTLEMIEQEYPILKDAYTKVGSEKMITASKRGMKKLQQELDVFNTKDALKRIVAKLFTEGEFYSRQAICDLLRPLYQGKNLGSPKSTDITFFFETGEEKRKTNQQTNVLEWGYEIGKARRPTTPKLFRADIQS